MNLYTRYLVLAAAVVTAAGCRKIPDYPNTPSISFKEVRKTTVTLENGARADNLDITLNFTDGNGDLGLSPNDTLAPFNAFNGDTVISGTTYRKPNPNHYNWITSFLIKQNGQFVPYVFPSYGNSYNGRFPRLSPEGKAGPIDGTITYTLRMDQVFFQPNTVVKFKIRIQDRALNKSNIIETPEIILREQ